MLNQNTKFFTNEPERDLYSRFCTMLQSNTQFFDVLVGYFRSTGFFKLYPVMEEVEKIRILVGLNVDYGTVQIINQARAGYDTDVLSHKEAIEAFKNNVQKEIEESEDSSVLEQGVHTFIEWLRSGKIEMRMYSESPIHAKLYIVRKDPLRSADFAGSVITGSSNFSMAGLKNNLEFNVELRDDADFQFARNKFEELWLKGIDINEDYIDTAVNKTHLNERITPYELYLKTIYEFFKEEINADKDTLATDILPDHFMRLQYQIDAVTQARKKLDTYGGVFISDVVGLGKTYICAMLAKSLKKGSRKLVICPPVLVDYWEETLRDFDVVARVLSLGKLDKIADDPKELARYDYVFVDEAHRFRNAETEGYNKLHKICLGKKVILISATPINNYATDIENQIYLFQAKKNSNIIPNLPNLESFFMNLRTKLNKLEYGTPEYSERIRKNSEEIRDRVLRNVLIRRTRKEIVEYYSDDITNQGLKFPKLGAPQAIEYVFDDDMDMLFRHTLEMLKEFSYSRYRPLTYLIDNSKYKIYLVGQTNLGGFMKSLLIKRLESSYFAFRMTLGRFVESYEKFISMFEKGDVYISKSMDVYELLESNNYDALLKMVEDEKGFHFKSSEFNRNFELEIRRDLAILTELKEWWSLITIDPKLDKLVMELRRIIPIKGEKAIIFTESKETANYLHDSLMEHYGKRLIVFTGESSEHLKREIEHSFNPEFELDGKGKFDVLVTTDVLAEGINLHRANIMINYDLPWNPTRIMQRGGRINRVGSKHDEIFIYNFFPTAQSDAKLSMSDRIVRKLQLFHDTLGDDFKYLSENERVSAQKLFESLIAEPDNGEEGINPELRYLALIRKIRDEDVDLFVRIKMLPLKARTAKKSTDVREGEEATISFIRQGLNKRFFRSTLSNTEELLFMEAIEYLESEAEEKSLALPSSYYELLAKNKNAFDDLIKRGNVEEVVLGSKGNPSENEMMKTLKALSSERRFTEAETEMIHLMIGLWKQGVIPINITKMANKNVKNAKDALEAYRIIIDTIPDRYLQHRIIEKDHESVNRQVVLSCFLKKEV